MKLLEKLGTEQGYRYDAPSDTMYGEKNGFKFAVQQCSGNQINLLLSVKDQYGTGDGSLAKEIKKNVRAVGGGNQKKYKLSCTIRSGLTRKKLEANILAAIDEVTAYLSAHQYVPCCEVTGDTEDVSVCFVGNVISFLSERAYSEKSLNFDAREQEQNQTHENYFLGTIGAFLGSVVGVAAIVIIGQLGYVSLLSGFVMGVCVIKGYELMAKRISKVSLVICVLIILGMTYFANQLDWSFTMAGFFADEGYDVNVFDTFPLINDMLKEDVIPMHTYIGNLLMIYISTVISAGAVIFSAMKQEKTKFEIRKLM